jgi:hypothetical protein
VGLFGCVREGGVIKNVGVMNATVTGDRMVGGLVGRLHKTNVSNSYISGNATGNEVIGGLVGDNFVSYMKSCYSTGRVTGGKGIGDLVGENLGYVSNSYSTASVTGNEHVGSLVGSETPAANSFWDVENSGIGVGIGGTGKTTVEMMDMLPSQTQRRKASTNRGI